MLIVQKFGGTSVESPERIRSVAARIAASRAEGHDVVVVVSAMGHTTDELIALASEVSKNPPHREMDMLLSAGERISMALLSIALADLQVPAVSFTGSQSGIITDGSHRRARIKRILGDRLRSAIADSKVAIVAGFQGVSEGKEITTLGRGGSDTTAVALAAALGAGLCEIYTDVDGVFSADPRWVSDAKFYSRVPIDTMVEFAALGATVLHPRCVELARSAGVALRVRNSLNDSAGTEVGLFEEGDMERFKVMGVTPDLEKLFLNVELARVTTLGALWDRARETSLGITSPSFSGTTVKFFGDRESEGDWRKLLNALSVEGFVKSFEIHPDLIPLSLVGHRLSQDASALFEIMDVLAKEFITPSWGVASAISVSVAIPLTHAKEAVQALHAHFMS